MTGFNSIVLGDHNAGDETEGALFVGGDYNRSGGQWDRNVNPRGHANVDVGGMSGTFFVGGSVYKRPHLASGDAKIGGTIRDSINNNGGGDIQTGVSGIPVDEVARVLKAASLDLSKLATTSNGTFDNRDANLRSFAVAGTSSSLAVFNISGDDLRGGDIKSLTADPSVTVIINVSGTHVTVSANANNNENNANVIFNFYEAITLNIEKTFNYSVLAPLANVSVSGGGIKGSVVSGTLNQYSEIRPTLFGGTLPPSGTSHTVDPPAVPLPASVLLLGGALGGLGLVRRGRRQAA